MPTRRAVRTEPHAYCIFDREAWEAALADEEAWEAALADEEAASRQDPEAAAIAARVAGLEDGCGDHRVRACPVTVAATVAWYELVAANREPQAAARALGLYRHGRVERDRPTTTKGEPR